MTLGTFVGGLIIFAMACYTFAIFKAVRKQEDRIKQINAYADHYLTYGLADYDFGDVEELED